MIVCGVCRDTGVEGLPREPPALGAVARCLHTQPLEFADLQICALWRDVLISSSWGTAAHPAAAEGVPRAALWAASSQGSVSPRGHGSSQSAPDPNQGEAGGCLQRRVGCSWVFFVCFQDNLTVELWGWVPFWKDDKQMGIKRNSSFFSIKISILV